MVTGSHELNIQELQEKWGLMAATSTCCASGTRDEPVMGTSFEEIPTSFDQRDAFAIMSEQEPLFN